MMIKKQYTKPSLKRLGLLRHITWQYQFPSDRKLKTNVAPVDRQKVLERLATMPISTWNYKNEDPSLRHIGPMAQDFNTIFGVGRDGEHIQFIDANGVALAAIQALYQSMQEKDELIAFQQAQIVELEARLADLENKRR